MNHPGDGADPTRRHAQGGYGAQPTRRYDGPPGDPRTGGPRSGWADGSDPTVRHAPPGGGRTLGGGRYRLEGLLGSGGMADVHRATDLRLNRPVAVKVFRPGTDPEGGRRFADEAQILANLRHPGLVAVHDYAVEGTRAYLVMELVEGPTLRQVLDDERLDPEEIERIGVEIAQVLSYVHGEGVVHRDVKPSNVLLDRDNRVRLADFGISRLVGSTGITGVDDSVGTPTYMAPEQVRGEPVGPPADVYALGLVLLEALTGRPEYPGEGWDAAEARLDHPPRVPSDVAGPLPRALRAMTAAAPTRRPTARQVAGMLIETAPEVEPEAAPRSRAPLVIGAAVVALIAIGGFALATSGSDEDPTAAAPTTAESSESAAEPTTEEAEPTGDEGGDTGGDGGGISDVEIPSELPELPEFSAPEFTPPEVPDEVAEAGETARSWWDDFSDWFSSLF